THSIVTLTDIDSINLMKGMERFNPVIENKSIIGIGEATHGSREFILAKSKFFIYLSSQHGFHNLAIEMPFSIGPILTDFINGKCSLSFIDSLLKPAKTLYCTEFFIFLQLLKEKNLLTSDSEKIRIWGIDLDQYYDYALMQLRTAVSSAGKRNADIFDSLALLIPKTYKDIVDFKKEYATPVIKKAITDLTIFFSDLSRRFTKSEQFLNNMYLLQLKNSFLFFSNQVNPFSYREEKMFENFKSIMVFSGPEKIMIWAHNLHVKKDSPFFKSFGEYVDENFPAKYFAIGSVFKQGDYRVWYRGNLTIMHLDAQNCGEFAQFLSSAPVPYYFISKEQLPKKFIYKKVSIHEVGIVQLEDNFKANKAVIFPAKSYDGYLYFDNVTALPLYK
ncbi:MAG: Erythromycin esterase, partial [Chitinophagaceae bacterium]|nr:Erythromycin esterase [Chitinophagaceae bacterium]